jgi:uncharacterized membrane protein
MFKIYMWFHKHLVLRVLLKSAVNMFLILVNAALIMALYIIIRTVERYPLQLALFVFVVSFVWVMAPSDRMIGRWAASTRRAYRNWKGRLAQSHD